ncbi:MAG: hypothetical protein NTY09_09595 [bacterium]|nr:hypothetical protein [bacterium]
MSFTWLISMLIFVILMGSERSHWGGLWGGDPWCDDDLFTGRAGVDRIRHKTDFEIRLEARKYVQPDVVMVSADDYIDKPDPDLERMISEGKIKEAREYRAGMEKIAEEMDDDAGMKKYAIYGAKIARKAKAVAVEERKKMLESPMEIPMASEQKPSSAMEIEKIAVSSVPGIAITENVSSSSAPPLWKVKKSTTQELQSKDFVPPKPFMKKPEVVNPPIMKMPDKPIEKIPEPSKPVYEKPEPIFQKPEPVTIPKDFTPSPSGPVALGATGGASGYTSGPVDLDAKLAEKVIEKEKEKAVKEEEAKKEPEEKINPDDYGDLISL